jgi:hypothetical protein
METPAILRARSFKAEIENSGDGPGCTGHHGFSSFPRGARGGPDVASNAVASPTVEGGTASVHGDSQSSSGVRLCVVDHWTEHPSGCPFASLSDQE